MLLKVLYCRRSLQLYASKFHWLYIALASFCYGEQGERNERSPAWWVCWNISLVSFKSCQFSATSFGPNLVATASLNKRRQPHRCGLWVSCGVTGAAVLCIGPSSCQGLITVFISLTWSNMQAYTGMRISDPSSRRMDLYIETEEHPCVINSIRCGDCPCPGTTSSRVSLLWESMNCSLGHQPTYASASRKFRCWFRSCPPRQPTRWEVNLDSGVIMWPRVFGVLVFNLWKALQNTDFAVLHFLSNSNASFIQVMLGSQHIGIRFFEYAGWKSWYGTCDHLSRSSKIYRHASSLLMPSRLP